MLPGTDETLLEQTAIARDILNQLQPRDMTSATDAMAWRHPTPIDWRQQAQFLWHSGYDAIRVVTSVLPNWASHSALAQVRLLIETQCLLAWLLGDDDQLVGRGLGLAMRDIEGNLRVARKFTGGKNTAQSIRNLVDAKEELLGLAREMRVAIERPPKQLTVLVSRHNPNLAPMYAYMSDVGVHAGLSYLEQFYQRDAEQPIMVDPGGAIGERSFFLGTAIECYLNIATFCAAATQWLEGIEAAKRLRDRLSSIVETLAIQALGEPGRK